MNESKLRELYSNRGVSATATDAAIQVCQQFGKAMQKQGVSFETVTVDFIKSYIKNLIEHGENDLGTLVALARYFLMIGRNEIYVYFTSLVGGRGVIENITERVAKSQGIEVAETLKERTGKLPLGTDPEQQPEFTANFMEELKKLVPAEQIGCVMAGNNHGIPREAFLKDKLRFEELGSLDEFLVEFHKRKVAELQEHCDNGTVWYEQTITQEVVDFVAGNQELLSAVREGDTLYITKIPYDPATYLHLTDPKMIRYYACHCPFVREAILKGEPQIPGEWCNCSAGFEKFPFDVILDRDHKAKGIASALKGDPLCRFAIQL